MDDQEFKELVLKEIKDAKAFRKNIKDALKKALYGDFDFNRTYRRSCWIPGRSISIIGK